MRSRLSWCGRMAMSPGAAKRRRRMRKRSLTAFAVRKAMRKLSVPMRPSASKPEGEISYSENVSWRTSHERAEPDRGEVVRGGARGLEGQSYPPAVGKPDRPQGPRWRPASTSVVLERAASRGRQRLEGHDTGRGRAAGIAAR